MDLSILKIDQQEVAKKNQKLLEKTGFVIHQQHGQKIYCDPNYSGPQPPEGTEIYCYRIPRDCFEYELVPVFSSCGKIFELRLMIEFSGANRSYCYVRYWDPEEAKLAIRKLHNFQIRPGYPLAVTQSVDNRKLCVKTVPPLQSGVTEEEIVTELAAQVSGVIRAKFIARRWLQLEFESHRHAALARRLLVPGNITIFGRVEIKQVDWADPEVESRPGRVAQPSTGQQQLRVGDEKVVVVTNVAAEIGEAEVRYWFNILTGGRVVNVIKGDCGVFFITLDSQEAALYAVEKGHQMEFGPTRINVAPISSQYSPKAQTEGNLYATTTTAGSFLNQVPPSLFVGPLEQLYNITSKQNWGNPQFSVDQSLSPLGQVLYRYSVSLPKVSPIAVPGEWDPDRSAALINCAVSTLREITLASLQSSQASLGAPPPAATYYRTPPPGPPQPVATSQFSRINSAMTAVRMTKEETNLFANEDPNGLFKLTSSLDEMSMKPVLAVPPNKKVVKDEGHYKNFKV